MQYLNTAFPIAFCYFQFMLKTLKVKFDGMKPNLAKEQGLSLSSLDGPLE